MKNKLVSLWNYGLRIGKKLSDDNINAFSAQAAFFLLISLFPFVMMLLALLQFFPFTMDDLINAASVVLPDAIEQFIVPVITEVYDGGTVTLLSVAAITTLWSASTGVNAVVRGLSKIYDSNESENWFKLRFESVFFMLGLILVIILSLGLFVFGSFFTAKIGEILPQIRFSGLLSSGFRSLCGLCVLTLVFDMIYVFAPKRKSRFTSEFPGAVIAAAGWIGFSYLYSLYVNTQIKFSIYGSLTVVVFFMLWLYICFYIMFLGAEINRYLQVYHGKQELKDLIDELKA